MKFEEASLETYHLSQLLTLPLMFHFFSNW